MRKLLPFLLWIAAFLPFAAVAETAVEEPLEDWQQVVRDSPYWISQGAFDNLVTIRRWVLLGQSFCENKDRHILFDRRAAFLGYLPNADEPEMTQDQLNELRQSLAATGRAIGWAAGGPGRSGYPFALSCDQPEAQLALSMARYSGEDLSARLWGTWDGLRVGTKAGEVSLHEAILMVYEQRQSQGRTSLPAEVLSTLAGKTLIESGGRQTAHSAANARGIMQLSEAVMKDCGLSERFYFHRLAQIDCALRLLEQNHRNLEPVFKEIFGHLPAEKADELYALLLIQAYHGGVGRIVKLMTEPENSGAVTYFARHHQRFSAGDIALGMVFHNLGRERVGFASLYYVADVTIAKQEACRVVSDLPGC